MATEQTGDDGRDEMQLVVTSKMEEKGVKKIKKCGFVTKGGGLKTGHGIFTLCCRSEQRLL